MSSLHEQHVFLGDLNRQDRTVTSSGINAVTTFETNEFWQTASATNNESMMNSRSLRRQIAMLETYPILSE